MYFKHKETVLSKYACSYLWGFFCYAYCTGVDILAVLSLKYSLIKINTLKS